MEHNLKKITLKEEKNYFKQAKVINALLVLSVGITFLSCAKNKEYETVYKTPELVEKSNLVSTDETYMYVPSTLQVPRSQSASRAYFQGDEKLVKFRYTEKNLEIIELDSDSRFSANEQNASPVISIPVAYKDFNCIENAQKECSQKEKENTDTTWNNKKFVLPDYSALKINEINTLDLISVDTNCASLTNTKLVNYEINSNTLNIELERTYQTSSDMRCIYPLYANDELTNASFKVRYFYSFVKLNSLISNDFKPFVYEKEDQRTFGFFKTEIKKLNKFYDFNRIEKQHLANHWNPNRTVEFFLDPKFYTEENKSLLSATEESFQKINDGLKQAGTALRIKVAGKATNSSGDLRYSRINLLDEPQASGLLGYGPSVANPLTGEIVQAHINMYSGVLIQTIRSTYDSMVDLGVNDKKNADNVIADNGAGKSIAKKIENYNNSLNLDLKNIVSKKSNAKRLDLSDTKKISSILEKDLYKVKDSNLTSKENKSKVNSLNLEEDKNDLIRANNKICDADLINFAKIAKKELPNIRLIPGVVSSEGKLLPWDQLTDEARQGVLDLILPKAYVQTLVHEIGHTLGLRHNFMGSYDKANFYSEEEANKLGLHTTPVYSSIMDYSNSELNSLGLLGKYDIAALRYMYSKKVETKEGQLVDIKTSVKDIEVPLKKYLFCTDENAGNSSTCNRFDEGSTLTEIALSQSEAYDNNYKYSYYRNGRNKFDIYGIDALTRRRYSDFERARQIFENYELYSSFYGSDLLGTGCTADMVAKYPVCKSINDVREATLVIARMFLNIIKTPDLSCYVEYTTGDNKTQKELVNLSEIVNGDAGYSMDYTPTGCFDPAVIKYFEGNNQKVLAHGGKYLNSVKEINPKFAQYSTDISIRGNFQDKLLALQFLVTRYLGVNGVEEIQGSMMDIKSVEKEVNNYFAHILHGEKLVNPIKFTDVNGKEVDVEYSLSHNSILPEPDTSLISNYFEFPTDSNAEFNRLAIKTAKRFSKSNDVDYRLKSQAFVDSLTVLKANKFNYSSSNIITEDLSITKVDAHYYLAGNENSFAKKMIDSISAEQILAQTDLETIEKVMAIKYKRIEIPEDSTDSQKTFAGLAVAMRAQLIEFKKEEASLTYEIIAPQVGDASAKRIILAYEPSLAQMNELNDLLNKKPSLGKDASEIEKVIFSIDIEFVGLFLDNILKEKNELYIKSLDMMSPLE